MRSVWLAPLLGLVGACSSSSVRQEMETPASVSAEAEIATTTAAFSQAIVEASKGGWTEEGVSRVVSFYTEDTVVFPPRGDPIRGERAIRAYWTRSPERRIISHSAVAERIHVSGDLATEHGQLRIVSQAGGSAPAEGN